MAFKKKNEMKELTKGAFALVITLSAVIGLLAGILIGILI